MCWSSVDPQSYAYTRSHTHTHVIHTQVNLGASDSKDYRGSALCHLGDLDGNGVDDMALGAYG